MNKVTLYEISLELGLTIEEIIPLANSIGYNITSPEQMLSIEQTEVLMEYIMSGTRPTINIKKLQNYLDSILFQDHKLIAQYLIKHSIEMKPYNSENWVKSESFVDKIIHHEELGYILKIGKNSFLIDCALHHCILTTNLSINKYTFQQIKENLVSEIHECVANEFYQKYEGFYTKDINSKRIKMGFTSINIHKFIDNFFNYVLEQSNA